MSKIAEKLKKFWRGLQREHLGQSNRITVPTVAVVGMTAIATETSIPNPDNRLQYEESRVMVEGSQRDIHRVRCLDNMIGKLSRSFNEKSREKIRLHIADVADSLKRIRAYKIAENEEKSPVGCLVYSSNGAPVATIKLG